MDGLVQGLHSYGITGTVAASRHGTQEAVYRHNGVEVYRYPLYPHPTKAQQRQQLPPGGFEYFSRWLEAHPADLYHQHSWRFGCGLHHLRLARQLGMPAIVTVHLPEVVCLRGTMMLHGQTACDGWIESARCGHCIGVPERVPPALARALSYVPLRVGTAAESELLNSDSIRLRQLARTVGIPPWVRRHRHLLLEMANLADRIVAVCQWLYDALLINGVPEEKLVLCRQGVGDTGSQTIARRHRHPDDPLRIGFLGRWQDTKGTQVLAAAIEHLPAHIPVELVIHGMVHGEADKVNRDLVLAMAQKDRRIQVAEKLSREEVPAAVASFDLLAVPSQGFETGPLVVLEAHAVGTPVIGSDVGGVNELVHHGVDGWLVPAADVNAWSEAIAQLATDAGLLAKLRQGIKPVRRMDDAVADMAKVYEDVIGHGAWEGRFG